MAVKFAFVPVVLVISDMGPAHYFVRKAGFAKEAGPIQDGALY
jgi:hypothetical protein